MIRTLVAALLLILAFPVAAQARTAKDCEAIQNPMEFNRCLASLSPVRGRSRATAPQADRGSTGGIRTVRRGGRVSSTIYLGGAPVERARGGRKRISFSVRG